MLYRSTRGRFEPVSASQAIKLGIAPDGGLFVPADSVTIENPERLVNSTYQERAQAVLQPFLTGFSDDEVRECVHSAYNATRFDTPAIAPLHKLAPGLHLLELWHGPTCAFKDMALQILPHLLKKSTEKTEEDAEIVILVATSGDTGKAALEGFRDVLGTRIIVFYPEQGVSEIQKRQMVTQEGNNVSVIAVRGNFDDAQSGVKAIFTDDTVKADLANRGFKFSSANSINWGRLVPQIAYYFSAYLDLRRDGEIGPREAINFVVPTGNFGNILAGFYARRMGLPIGRLICAANRNNVLTDFIRTGVYDRNRAFVRTLSPSMDILISSNLERLLFELTGHDNRAAIWMEQLRKTGRYAVDTETVRAVTDLFWSDFADDTETINTIRTTYRESGYPMDTHTAVGRAVYDKYRSATGDATKTVVVSTASPFKFNESVSKALLDKETVAGRSEFELLEILSGLTGWIIPPGLRDLDKKPIRHDRVVDREGMQDAVLQTLRK
ncbi:MAG: threonine synthase [Firmicutes bacterium]|nr:threonine synthase [Bacillota bacterium]MBU4533469.1 threonine synthase [Bacillota bacterium]MBV1727338.1 threonine synthase [Desulforudis sp.]MBV1734623.1 threonine synthase [Desulforudis sp.]